MSDMRGRTYFPTEEHRRLIGAAVSAYYNTPKGMITRKENADRLRKCWEDPAFKQMHIDKMRELFTDTPKPASQRKKMSEASLGKPKSDAHRAAMAKSQALRRDVLFMIQDLYDVKHLVACKILKANREYYYSVYKKSL